MLKILARVITLLILLPVLSFGQTAKKAAPVKPKHPRDAIKWTVQKAGGFKVHSQPRTGGVPTPNLNLKFEGVYQTLRRNIPWLVAAGSDVYVYQNRANFLRYEPYAHGWAGALFSPNDMAIMMYDEPKEINRIISSFSHELTHLFVEGYFNAPGAPNPVEPPVWLNEGLAVNMEDISASAEGGVWANDLLVYNILQPEAAADKPKEEGSKLRLSAPISSAGAAAGRRGAQAQQAYPGGPRLSSKRVTFKNFKDFIKDNSYDIAVKEGWQDDWYFQAYAMVRFLFKPYNAQYPEKRMKFEQLMKLLKANPAAQEKALSSAYGFRNPSDFEAAFYAWLYDYQKTERAKITESRRKR